MVAKSPGPSREANVERIELQQGGMYALAAVFERHRQRLRKMVELRLDVRVAVRISADDVLQESFVEASRRLEDYLTDAAVPVFIWLRFLVGQQVRIAHRRHLATNKRSVGKEFRIHHHSTARILKDVANRLLSHDSTPSAVASKRELYAQVRHQLESLDEIDREILTLRHYEELTNAEVAVELLISQDAASKRYRRALRRLRSSIDRPSS